MSQTLSNRVIMKILFFVAQFPCTSETFVLNQVTSMIDKGHDVRIYSWGKADPYCTHVDIEKYNLRSKTLYMDMEVPYNHAKRLLKIIPKVLKLFIKYGISIFRLSSSKYGDPLRSKNLIQYYIAQRFLHFNWNPDIIISHFGDNGILITALRNAGVIPPTTKCFTYFHAHEICRMSVKAIASFYRPMFNEYDTLLPINHLWKERLIAAGANPHKVIVLHMGVNLERFNYIENNITEDTIHILSVGRLCGQKGYEYAIRGVAEYVKYTKKKISYKIIGRGELEEKLKNLVNNINASDFIHFIGAQPQHVVAEEMEKANVFLLPSVTDDNGYMEGIPVALMEAMARGIICISTYHSGIPELIEDGRTGFLCKEKDSEGIAKALLKTESLSNIQLNSIRQNARSTIESDFDVIKETQKLQELVEKQ